MGSGLERIRDGAELAGIRKQARRIHARAALVAVVVTVLSLLAW